jgi:hypothetical protein
MKAGLPVFDFAQAVDQELSAHSLPRPKGSDGLSDEAHAAELLKRMAVWGLKIAAETFGLELEKHQSVMARVSDIVIDAFALDTVVTRTRQVAAGGKVDPVRQAMVRQLTNKAHSRAIESLRGVLSASLKGEALTEALEKAQQLFVFLPHDPDALSETIVQGVLAAGGYPFALQAS